MRGSEPSHRAAVAIGAPSWAGSLSLGRQVAFTHRVLLTIIIYTAGLFAVVLGFLHFTFPLSTRQTPRVA